jgi:fumarate reductase flavoprotein subunit
LAAALRTQPGCVAYEILGAAALQELNAIEPYFAAEIAPRTLRRAEELSHLANQFELDPDTLQRTVSVYNAAIDGGGDPFGRTSVRPPLAPPFFGIRVGAALLQTEGGLAIDAGARVLRTDGTPIPNLYAGGGAAAGLSAAGGSGYLEGNGLLCALGWGKIAGEQARQEIIAARGTAAAAPDSPEDEPQ